MMMMTTLILSSGFPLLWEVLPSLLSLVSLFSSRLRRAGIFYIFSIYVLFIFVCFLPLLTDCILVVPRWMSPARLALVDTSPNRTLLKQFFFFFFPCHGSLWRIVINKN